MWLLFDSLRHQTKVKVLLLTAAYDSPVRQIGFLTGHEFCVGNGHVYNFLVA